MSTVTTSASGSSISRCSTLLHPLTAWIPNPKSLLTLALTLTLTSASKPNNTDQTQSKAFARYGAPCTELFSVDPRPHVSRLMLRPKRAYSATLSSCISSRTPPSRSSTAATSTSIFCVEAASSSCTSGTGRVMKESPILYLRGSSVHGVAGGWMEGSWEEREIGKGKEG